MNSYAQRRETERKRATSKALGIGRETKDVMGAESPIAEVFAGNVFLDYAGFPSRRSQSIVL
jgi:hypothetical protein